MLIELYICDERCNAVCNLCIGIIDIMYLLWTYGLTSISHRNIVYPV